MTYKIFINKKAEKTLNKHIVFLSKVSISATIKLKKDIVNNIKLLIIYPRIGIRYLNKKLPFEYRKMVINKNYTLIYFIVQNNIYIDSILDSRQRINISD